MPPQGGGKRKRGDRQYSDDNYSRPSPHRPSELNLAQQSHSTNYGRDSSFRGARGGRGDRRPSRGGRNPQHNSSPIDPMPDSNQSRPPASEPLAPRRENPPTITTTRVASPEPVKPYDPFPFNYTYVSDEVCEKWEREGKESILQIAKDAVDDRDELTLTVLMEELLKSALSRRISSTEAGSVAEKIIGNTDQADEDTEASISQTALLNSISIAVEADSNLPAAPLADFIVSTGISHNLLRVELDAGILEKLGLIRNTFGRMGIRKQTNILYRQANFNLMREESEGFAKLMTELFTTSSNETPSGEVVQATVEKVKAMIGAFDLDVGRSLDVVLDVFGAVLVKQYRFFVKFLRTSPWWPRKSVEYRGDIASGLPAWAAPNEMAWNISDQQRHRITQATQLRDAEFWQQARDLGLKAYHLIGRREATSEQIERAQKNPEDSYNEWLLETRTLPPNGNRDAAQLLGFKLRFYSSNIARDETDVLPDNLIYLSALLIKIGFISLKDLYPHIWRSDEAMEDLQALKQKEKLERERSTRPGAGARNALLMAGALPDDTAAPPIPSRMRESNTRAGTPSRESEPEKPTTKELENADQKLLLLKSLLAIGAMPEALFIIGKFPWLLDLDQNLPEYLNRILHYSLSKVYEQTKLMPGRESLQSQKPTYETELPGLPKGQVKVVDVPSRKVLRWALLDKDDSSDGLDYRFYWDEWNDNVPICQSVEDVFTLYQTLLPLVGVKIGQDPALVTKLARIGKQSLENDTSSSNKNRWLDLCTRILLPSLSLTKSNAGVVNEVFELISQYPINTRYLMYLEWSQGRVSRNPDIKAAFDQAKAETKDTLKRISKTNVRPMARALARIAYANPHIVITTALAQIEAYDSIAEVFVEGARYFTELGYDVLTWALISSMARAGRSRTQDGGIFASKWLTALAQFAGKIYRRYVMMKPGPILQYVSEQLDHGNSTDLKMLEHIVSAMAGITSDTNYNDSQIQAMGGGPLLQSQTILQLLDQRHNSKSTSKRLVKSLLDSGLAGKFLLSMAQQRQSCVFTEQDVPLKVIGNTYDEIQRVMVQYLDLLRSSLTAEEFQSQVPDVVQLLIRYHLRPEIAFWICRPLISRQILDFEKQNKAQEDTKEANADIEMSDQINGASEEDGEAEEEGLAEDVSTPLNDDVNGPGLELDTTEKSTSPEAVDAPWHPVMKDLMEAIAPSLPENIINTVGAGFYTTFWQLSLYDIAIPGKSYEDELSRQSKKIASIGADRSDVSLIGVKKREAEKKQISDLVDSLLAENKHHLKAFAESKARLNREKDQWFVGKARLLEELNTALMEYCFLPRLLSSALDSYFCFKFIKFMHSVGTANFRTIGIYDLLFRSERIASLIFTCTSKEADNLGRFLNEVLKDLARWHKDKSTYEREAFGFKKHLPGFAVKVENGKVVTVLDFENFRRLLWKWHSNLFNALQKCLSSTEYMHIRNAISILRAVHVTYPTVTFHGTSLQKAVSKLRDSDKEDLKVSSQALLGALHSREKNWMIPQAFRQGQDRGADRDSTPNATEPAKAVSAKGESKDVIMTEGARADSKEDTRTDAKPPPARDDSRPASRPDKRDLDRSSRTTASNGSSTPRSRDEIRHSRSIIDTSLPSLPRRLSPPPRGSPPVTLPNRPDVPDSRNGFRESQRPASRTHVEPSRSTPDARQQSDLRASDPLRPYPRDSRSLRESPAEPERFTRRHDRSDPPPVDRERERFRELETRPSERPHQGERDRHRPNEREPPRPNIGRERIEPPREPPRTLASEANSVAINPERAALINNTGERPGISIRGQGQEKPSRSSRPTSPRREEDRRPPPRIEERPSHPPRDDRPHSHAVREDRPHGNTPREDRSHVSTPRDDRSHPRHERDDRSQARHDREDRPPRPEQTRNAPNPLANGPRSNLNFRERQYPPVDMQHGRLEQETSRPATREGPADEVPSGPRSRPNGRRGPTINTQITPPTGPAGHSRSGSFQGQSTPETSGVHPDRLNQIVPSPTEPRAPRHLPPQNLPSQNLPPSGPRSNIPQGPPSGPSPVSRAPPTGPQINDNSRSNRNPLNTVNTTLAQAGRGTSIRGRGNARQNSTSFNPHMPPPNREGFQQDLFAQSPNSVPIQARAPRQDTREEPRPRDDRENERKPSRPSGRPEEIGDSQENRAERRENRHEERQDDRQSDYRPRRDDSGRKSGRNDEGAQYEGGMGRGGPRLSSESKRGRKRFD